MKTYSLICFFIVYCTSNVLALPGCSSPTFEEYRHHNKDFSNTNTINSTDYLIGGGYTIIQNRTNSGSCNEVFSGNLFINRVNETDSILCNGNNAYKLDVFENIYFNDSFEKDGTLFSCDGEESSSCNSFTPYCNLTGEWSQNTQMGYLGFKTYNSNPCVNNFYIGWMRFKTRVVGSEINVYLIDRYQRIINQSYPDYIITPEFISSKVITATPSDISNNGNASDLALNFQVEHADDIGTSEYRVFVVKEENIGSFDTLQAQSNPNYISISATGSTSYNYNFNPTSVDSDGDIIVEKQLYRICILSVADGVYATKDNFYKTLYISFEITSKASTVKEINAYDVADNGNGSDLRVIFKRATNESFVSEYRVFVVKDGTPLSVSDAESNSNYVSVSPTSNWEYNVYGTPTSVDSDGDLIAQVQPYRVYILSIADGIHVTDNDLSEPSNVVTLTSAASVAQNIIARDIGNNGNATDLEVEFAKGVDESTISEYRVFVLKHSIAPSFTQADAEANPNYKSVTPSGANNYVLSYLVSDVDSDGDVIIENEPYIIFVLSIADGSNATRNSHNCAYNTITLSNMAVASSVASNIIASDISDNQNATDLQVKFNKASNETNVSEYRMFVVFSNSSFSLTNAENNTNYKTIMPSGLSQYTINYLADDKDANGNSINQNISYKVYILSVADGTNAAINGLSTPSNSVILKVPTASAASNVIASDISDIGDASDLEVKFNKAQDETTLSEYRVFVVKSGSAFSENTTNYKVVVPSGLSQYTVSYISNDIDTDGNIIVENQRYNVFILSMADGINTIANKFSPPSEITLMPTPASSATSVFATDISNNGNATDLQVKFSKAADETTVSEYRIFVVSSSSFSLENAEINTNYKTIVPSGLSQYTVNYLANDKDVDGNSINQNTPYKVYVLSMADGVIAIANKLSSPSKYIILTLPTASSVSNVNAFDISNNGNATDLQVKFNKASNEATVYEYRVFVVKSSSSFSLATAEGNSNYKTIAPIGLSQYTLNYLAIDTDTNGDIIIENQAYKVYILSIADGINTIVNSLSSASNTITLTSPVIASSTASNISAQDISNNGDATDLEVKFNKGADENTVDEYRIFVVKDGTSFSKTIAESNSNFKTVSPSGLSQYTINYLATDTDTNGDIIIENQPYRVYILSMADGTIATANSLSSTSNIITLISPTMASNISAQDISNNGDASDLQVRFNKADDEATVGEYRAFVVKDGTSFSKTIAESNNNYKTVSPSGLSQYTINYLAADTDTNGDIIIENQPYRVYVLSMADGTIATINSLSPASNRITLTTPVIASSKATNIVASDIANNKDGRDLQVEFNKASTENTLSEYRVLVCKYYNTFNLDDAINNNNYTVVSKSGNTKYIVNFSETTLDTDGDLIAEDVWYKVYVMSVADGVNANANSLSNPSNNIKLTTPLAVKEHTKNLNAFYANNLLQITIDNTLIGADIEVVNLLGEKILSNQLNNANNQFSLNVGNGVYMVIVRKDNAVMTKKIVVQ
jgi:trimeric autotransporter adhesin